MFRLSFFALILSALRLQSQPSLNGADILHSLQKLDVCGSVLYIAAHPDDENTRLLSYLANEKKFRTAYLSITRGDGGQNLIGKEQAEPLGLIRTQELLAARRIDGAEQFFTRANDFGFSKNPEETLRIWNKDSILSDMVYVIRKVRPDVIICRFPTTGEGGHGHHTASAILALEAFDAAADPNKFTWQLSKLQTWQTKRVFWNTFNFGTGNTITPDQLKIDVGLYNPLLGKSYGEIAAESRSNHKSQGFGSMGVRGTSPEYFKQLKGDSVKSDLFENINTKWERFPGTAPIQNKITSLLQKYNVTAPENSLEELGELYRLLSDTLNNPEDILFYKKQKREQVKNLMLACAGVWLEALAPDFSAIPGSLLSLSVQAVNRSSKNITLKSIQFNNSDTVCNVLLNKDQVFTYKHWEKLPETLPFSSPYWLQEPHSDGQFILKDKWLTGTPENAPPVTVKFKIAAGSIEFDVVRPVIYKTADPVKGELRRTLEILPPVIISALEKNLVFTSNKAKTLQVKLSTTLPSLSGELKVILPAGWKSNQDAAKTITLAAGEEKIITVTITPQDGNTGKAQLFFESGENKFDKGIRRIAYDHIPPQFMLVPCEIKLVKAEVKITSTRIGYIPGAGDDVAAALSQIGYDVHILSDEYLSSGDLSSFSAIITGIRAFNTNEKLKTVHPRLFKYVENGGNLIVQYNTNSRVGPLQQKTGPYPFTITRDRVTDENAEVHFILPDHPALNAPNKITKNDFENWIQERGIYFASEADRNYQNILLMKDPGEKELNGSLIIAKYGKGNYVYTGLSFFRQLPAGVPGAYRLFANLISLPKNK